MTGIALFFNILTHELQKSYMNVTYMNVTFLYLCGYYAGTDCQYG